MDGTHEERIDYLLEYRDSMKKLQRYRAWMEEHREKQVFSEYEGPGEKLSAPFPVYDSTLMSFVKEAKATPLMDKNYPYVYTRYHIRTPEDERRAIREAKAKDIDKLRGILSKYVMGGQTKASVWPQGVKEGIFAELLTKFAELSVVSGEPKALY